MTSLCSNNLISYEIDDIIKNNKFTGEYIPITGKQNSKLAYLNEICKKKKLDKIKIKLNHYI